MKLFFGIKTSPSLFSGERLLFLCFFWFGINGAAVWICKQIHPNPNLIPVLQHNINYVATDGSNEPDWTNLKKGALVSDGL